MNQLESSSQGGLHKPTENEKTASRYSGAFSIMDARIPNVISTSRNAVVPPLDVYYFVSNHDIRVVDANVLHVRGLRQTIHRTVVVGVWFVCWQETGFQWF